MGPQARSLFKYYADPPPKPISLSTRNRLPARAEDVDACKVATILMLRDLMRERISHASVRSDAQVQEGRTP